MNTAAPVQSRSNQKMEHYTRGFLKGLNSGERTLPERLSPKSARDLLVEARRMRWILLVLLSFGCSISSAQIEPNAGKWKTWVLTSSDQLRLPPPPDEATTRDEIAQLKEIAKQRDAGALERITWWNAGPPGYRWTSIAIPPGPASATVHSRIMALLSVAIYDATVAAWDSKYAYNRPRPTAFDPSLTAVLQNPQSPSYPSEHAVVAGAASTVLAYLFPDKADDFKSRAEEEVQVWVQGGLHYPSDVKAGLELGRAVGALVVEWAKRDGSDKTGSVDIPPGVGRWTGINPVAPFAGTRKTWVLSSGNQLRPGPPPDCRSSQGQAELAEVRNYPRTFESNATAFYWQSGRSNWNNVIDQKIFEYRLDINPPRAARVYALAYVAAYDATVACWDAKYTYWAIRPFMLGVTPLFTTPNHPSYPAAHGSFSGSISAVLASLFPQDAAALNALGTEAGESRLWAGIHFRSDIDTGLALGRAVAKLVIERAEKDGSQ
jgi:membrane-associated phospholipid phosphatase